MTLEVLSFNRFCFFSFSLKEKVSPEATDEVLMLGVRPSSVMLRMPPSPARGEGWFVVYERVEVDP